MGEIEQKHANVVINHRALYQKKLKGLNQREGPHNIELNATVSTQQCESNEAAEATAALSSLAAPPVAKELSGPAGSSKQDGCAAVKVAIQLPSTFNVESTDTPPPLDGSDSESRKKKDGRGKRNLYSSRSAISQHFFKRDISEISDSGSGSGSCEEYEDNQPAKKTRKKHHWGAKQEEQVQKILPGEIVFCKMLAILLWQHLQVVDTSPTQQSTTQWKGRCAY